jgi:hypothetical protein
VENKVITLQVNFTRKSLLMVLGIVLLVAGLVVGGVVLAQAPGEPEAEPEVQATEYDDTLYPKLPPRMNYQGVLKDDAGNLIDGSHELTLTIYKRRQIGISVTWNEVYSETQTVEVNDGLFNVVIGQSDPLNPGDFGGLYRVLLALRGGELELGIKVDGGAELTPRVKLLPVPYAFRAEYVNRFPAPHYNSGWIDFPDGVTELTHDLGGDPDNYVVDMMCKSTLADPLGAGVHNWFLGGEGYWNVGDTDFMQYGAFWRQLDSDSIEVYRYADDAQCGQVRIRIWRID